MIDLNVPILIDGHGDACISFPAGEEVRKLVQKYKGVVNVKLSRPTDTGTEQQNRLMHALLAAYFVSGYHSAPCRTLDEFKLYMKMQYGPCYDYEYQGRPVRVTKSWAKYTKQERMAFIDSLISEVLQSGAGEVPKIQEILTGIEDAKEEVK